ncbi:MAG TPA: hypothetical protein VFH38_09620 [Jatrophihabitans sp.]|nr:hypothetical protein [Jatrophihabitans sp.]
MLPEITVSERRLADSVVTLVAPTRANGAAVILAHGGTDDGRRIFQPAAVELARAGYTVALPATRMALHRDWALTQNSISRATRVHRQALDLLAGQPLVDPIRLGFYGHSVGALQGAILLREEPRVRAAVLAAFGTGSLRRFAVEDLAPCSGYLDELDRYDPGVSLGCPHRAPVLLQFGEHDDSIRRDEAAALSAAAVPPVITRWYDCGHGVDADTAATRDRKTFFDTFLEVRAG